MTRYEKVSIKWHKRFSSKINKMRLVVMGAIPLYPKQSASARALRRLLRSIDQCKCIMDDTVYHENLGMGLEASEIYYPSRRGALGCAPADSTRDQ